MKAKTEEQTNLANPMYLPIPPQGEPTCASLTLWRDTSGRIRYVLACCCTSGQVSYFKSSWDALMAFNNHVRAHAARLAQ